jgi:transposase
MPRLRNSEAKLMPTARTTIGLDIGDRQSHFCSIDDAGEIIARGKVRTTQPALHQYFAGLMPSCIALEAGTHSMWIERLAKSLGHETIVANAREVSKIHKNDRKNDRTDAEILARLARVDPVLLCPITHRDEEMHHDLAVIRARDVLVRARAQCVNAVRGLVKSSSGSRLMQCHARSFARKTVEQLPDQMREALAPMFATITTLTEQIRLYDRKIDELAKKYPASDVLQQITGVGALTAVAYMLTLGDPTRFRTSRDVGAYLGMVPRQDDSGDHTPQLRITRAGNELVRKLLVQGGHYILGHFGKDCALQRYGKRVMAHGGKNARKRAVVAVARKLAILMHHLWITGEVYNPFHGIQEVQAA